MRKPTKDIERLINRRLDGVLGAEEELQLDRELIRDPQARQLMDDYTRIDGLANAALAQAFAQDAAPFDVDQLSARPPVRPGYYRARWLIPGVVAAAVLAIFVARVPWEADENTPILADRSDIGSHAEGTPQGAKQPWRAADKSNRDENLMHNASSFLPSSVQRDWGRETIGVLGDDGNVYWIEVERTRTIRRVSPRVARQWATGGV